jgi:Ring finger domain
MLAATMYCATFTWLLMTACTMAQTIAPSNSTTDLHPESTSPRFLLNGTETPHLPVIRLAPLGEYAVMTYDTFLSVKVNGHLVNVNSANANFEGSIDQFSYISCDPSAYTGNLGATDVFTIVVNQPRANIVILYSETSEHCSATGLSNLPTINGILTTTDVMAASMIANLNLNVESKGSVTILPDLNAFTNSSDQSRYGNSSGLSQSPTTAVAMIILYAITGLITGLFVVIIVTGAIRAHRHPERYGPAAMLGGGRQSRARGVARAMLDTLPIVKFGDREVQQHKPVGAADIEMNPARGNEVNAASNTLPVTTDTGDNTERTTSGANADGTDAEGQLGCSICTDDFNKGEEVRVLPCNHKFHPDCVDPWLLNVSGTCPLCRIDLRPEGEETSTDAISDEGPGGSLPPPLGGVEGSEASRRRDTIVNLRQMASGSSEERIAALRRLRRERSASNENAPDDNESRGITRRFRERLRIRTERSDPDRNDRPMARFMAG